MIPPDFDECFEALGLEPRVSLAAVRARYRRLVFRHHPDRTNDDAYARHRFQQVTHAYKTLTEAYAKCNPTHPFGRCQRCSEADDLFRAPDGNYYCHRCSTDRRGRRGLPQPPVLVATCSGVMVALAAAAVLLVQGVRTGAWGYLAASLASTGVALVWLMVLCLTIRYTVLSRQRRRVARR